MTKFKMPGLRHDNVVDAIDVECDNIEDIEIIRNYLSLTLHELWKLEYERNG